MRWRISKNVQKKDVKLFTKYFEEYSSFCMNSRIYTSLVQKYYWTNKPLNKSIKTNNVQYWIRMIFQLFLIIFAIPIVFFHKSLYEDQHTMI